MSDTQMGAWGGEHISLEITDEGGSVEYDCGRGTIDGRIVTDEAGRFDVRGTHVREHGGPVRKDEKPDEHPARYVGRIEGDVMTLAVTETDTGESVGTYTLTRGAQAKLMKCR